MKLFNTLKREKEEFVPIGEVVKTYSCGPTVYSYAHIGNMRAYLFMDSLIRGLKFCGFKVQSMMNITDVGHLLSDGDEGEDKMEIAGRQLQKTPAEIAKIYTEAFVQDLARLNITLPDIVENATCHIDKMIDFVARLERLGYAYETDDGIYFDIEKFGGYGQLSGQKLEGQIAGARVGINAQKRHPADFALWKKAPKEHIMQWESPWGMGFPGWHIECSALSREFLGERFDIHTGGIDHIPVHHENEIAQNDALSGKKSVNYWLHVEFMQFDGGKMSKSLGNVFTVSDLIKRGYSPMAFRYFCLNTHYRKALNFTFEALGGAATAFNRLLNQLILHKNSGESGADIDRFRSAFFEAVSDDLNYPLAVGIVWEMVKLPPNRAIFDAVIEFDAALGLNILAEIDRVLTTDKEAEIPSEVLDLAKERLAARKNRDFKQSDVLRDKIAALGYAIIDTKDGFSVKKL